MPSRMITVLVDPQTASVYDSVRQEDQLKIQAILGLWLRELTSGGLPSLKQILDEAGRKAEARGLTPEILDSFLKGA